MKLGWLRWIGAAAAALFVSGSVAVGQEAPLNLNALYQAAQPGATIVVPAGEHPSQELRRDPDKPPGSAPVTIRFEPGARIGGMLRLGNGNLEIPGPDGLVLDTPRVGYLLVWNTDRLTVNDLDSESWDIFSSRDVRFNGGEIGPCVADATKACVPRVAGSQRVVVDRHLFQAITSSNYAAYHVDGIAVFGSQDVTIRRSRFTGNAVTNLRAQNCCGNPPLANLVLEHNWFGVDTPANGDGSIELDSPMTGLVVRFNSFDERTGIQMLGDWTGKGARLVGNLYRSAGCYPGVSYERNYFIPFSAFTGQQVCGTNVKVASFGYRDQAGFDFRLTEASPVYLQRDLYEQAAPAAAAPPPPPPPPPPGLAAPMLTLQSFTQRTVTVVWKPVAGAAGYRFYLDGALVSSTSDPARSSVKFSVVWGKRTIGVEAFTASAVARGQVLVEGRWVALGS